MLPTFFPSPAELRAWFARHAATERELLVGFYKLGSGRPSITWPESVDGSSDVAESLVAGSDGKSTADSLVEPEVVPVAAVLLSLLRPKAK